MLAGLIRDEERTVMAGLPGLSDLPLDRPAVRQQPQGSARVRHRPDADAAHRPGARSVGVGSASVPARTGRRRDAADGRSAGRDAAGPDARCARPGRRRRRRRFRSRASRASRDRSAEGTLPGTATPILPPAPPAPTRRRRVAAGSRTAARRIAAALSWASAVYLCCGSSSTTCTSPGPRRHHVESASLVFVVAADRPGVTASPATSPGEVENRRDQPRSTLARGRRLRRWGGAALLAGALHRPVRRRLRPPSRRRGRAASRCGASSSGRRSSWSGAPLTRDRAGNRPLLLHAVNVVLHGANAFLVYSARRRDRTAASAGRCAPALLFLSFPGRRRGGRVAVGHSGRPDDDVRPGRALLAIAQLAVTIARVDRRGGALLLAGLLTKETAIAAPLLLAGCSG